MKKGLQQAGFTLVEIAIVVPILAITALSLMDALTTIIRTSAISRAQINITYDAQTALDTIEDDVLLASSFLPTIDDDVSNPITVSDPYKPSSNGGLWSYLGDTSSTRSLILRSYATTTNSRANNREAVYFNTNGCTPTTIYTNDALNTNIVYFVKDSILYRRILTDTSKATCSPQYQKQSCPTAESLGGSRNAICQADDEIILKGVSNFSVTYLASSSGDTALDVYSGGADPLLVTTGTTIKIEITSKAGAGTQTATNTSSIRITKLNPNKELGD